MSNQKKIKAAVVRFTNLGPELSITLDVQDTLSPGAAKFILSQQFPGEINIIDIEYIYQPTTSYYKVLDDDSVTCFRVKESYTPESDNYRPATKSQYELAPKSEEDIRPYRVTVLNSESLHEDTMYVHSNLRLDLMTDSPYLRDKFNLGSDIFIGAELIELSKVSWLVLAETKYKFIHAKIRGKRHGIYFKCSDLFYYAGIGEQDDYIRACLNVNFERDGISFDITEEEFNYSVMDSIARADTACCYEYQLRRKDTGAVECAFVCGENIKFGEMPAGYSESAYMIVYSRPVPKKQYDDYLHRVNKPPATTNTLNRRVSALLSEIRQYAPDQFITAITECIKELNNE